MSIPDARARLFGSMRREQPRQLYGEPFRPPRWTVSRGAAFWLVALAFAVTMLGTTLPTPLYVFYQYQLGLSTLMGTIIFAAYAFGVIAALTVFGRVSDVIGRRKTLLPALACATLSSAVFLFADSVALLLAGRILSGLSAGIFVGTATATLVDLAGENAKDRAAVAATVANMGGLGTGPLLSGVLAQVSSAPLQSPFAVHLALLAVAAAGVWMIPEPVEVANRRCLPIPRMRVPKSTRDIFMLSSIAGFAGFAVLGLFTAVAPLFLRELFEVPDPAFSGAMVCIVFVASALGQFTLNWPRSRGGLADGCGALVVGMTLMAAALDARSLQLLIAAGVVAGLGQGLSFRAALVDLNAAAPPAQRAEVASAFFLIVYFAISVPVIGVGFAADLVGIQTAGFAFSLTVAVLAATVLVVIRRNTSTR